MSYWARYMAGNHKKRSAESFLKRQVRAWLALAACLVLVMVVAAISMKIAFYLMISIGVISGICGSYLLIGSFTAHSLECHQHLIRCVPFMLLFILMLGNVFAPELIFARYKTLETHDVMNIKINGGGRALVSVDDEKYLVDKAYISVGDNVLIKSYYFDSERQHLSNTRLCGATKCYVAELID